VSVYFEFVYVRVDECRGFVGLIVDLAKLQDRWALQTVAFERRCLHIYHRDNLQISLPNI
jgi:hypothetical protein